MKRFITYVYVYESGVKGKNVGFIKAELRDGMVRMEMQLRGMGRYQGKVDLDLIVPSQESDCGIRLPFGQVEFHHGMANAYLEDKEVQIASSAYAFSQVVGVRMDLDDTHYLASCWVEHAEKCVCHPKPVGEQNSEQKPYCGNKEEQDCARKADSSTIVEKVERQILEKSKETCVGKPAESNSASATLRKIDISDIHKFPKQNWYLCNNSFLIHGFFNYHHLVVKKVTENSQTKYYLGVPGVYDKPERMMALLFGFPEFEAANEEQNFGYWYCLLDM